MRVILTLLLAGCLSLPLFGQQTPVATPTPAPAAQESVGADVPTREQLFKLFTAMELRKQMFSMLHTMESNMEEMQKSQMPELTRKQQGELNQLQNELYGKIFNDEQVNVMLEAMVPIYQRHFSKTDVNGIIAFYSSPLGKKMIEEQPKIAGEYMPKIMSATQERLQTVMKEMNYDQRVKTIMNADDNQPEEHEHDKNPNNSK